MARAGNKFLTYSSCYLHRHPNGIRSGGERNPIGRRTESDRAADGKRSGGERYTMTIREKTIKNLYCSMSRNTPIGFVDTRLRFVFL